MPMVSPVRLIMASLPILLAACGGPSYSTNAPPPATQVGEPCPVGSTCETLGGNVGAEHERLNNGLEADDPAALESEAAKIRGEDPQKLEDSIRKMEGANP